MDYLKYLTFSLMFAFSAVIGISPAYAGTCSVKVLNESFGNCTCKVNKIIVGTEKRGSCRKSCTIAANCSK